MTLMIDGRTAHPETGKTYRQFMVDHRAGREPITFDEGAILVTAVRTDSYTFDVIDSPAWNRPMYDGRGCSSRMSNFDVATQLGWYRVWVPIIARIDTTA